MKNDPSSSRPIASSTLLRGAMLAPARKTITALFVASVLSGCAAISTFPEKVSSFPEKFRSLPDKVNLEIPANTRDFRNRLYAGVGMGSSRMSPNTRGEGFSVDSSGDMGTQLRLGYDVHNMLAVEVDTSVLGETALRANRPGINASATVDYSAAAVSALVYGWSGVQMRSRREGLSAYGRFGFSSLQKSSNVIELDESGIVPIVGIGAEYGFVNGLGVRAEVTRFDSDLTFVGVGAIYRFGISPRGIGRMIAEAAEPALAGANPTSTASAGQGTVVERYAGPGARPGHGSAPHLHYKTGAEPDANYVGSMSSRWRPAMRSDDTDADGVLDNADSCPDTGKHVTVDRYGCGLFDAVLHEVTFKSGSHWLTPRARAQLDLLADTLLAFPEARIQARAHTDSLGPADKNLGLSSRRAEVVVQYLQSRGVHELQLQAVGMGEAQPLDSNKTSKGRKRNRRVDIVTLPDQDAGQLLVASNVESTTVMTVQSTEEAYAHASGVMIGSEDWNSRSTKKKSKSTLVAGKSASEPGLMAAKPVSNNDADKKALRVRGKGVNVAPAVSPLPQPGYAPNFPFSGVLQGVSFDGGNSELAEDSQKALEPLIEALKRNQSVKIAVMAHTDNSGGIERNKALSKQRADAVVRHIVEGGVAAERLRAEGYGELLPLVQNVTDADRIRNRRIEVRVLRSEDD